MQDNIESSSQSFDIAVLGAGYVGLVTGLCFAELGHQVYFYDIDKEKINNLQSKRIGIYESGIEALLEHNKKKLIFTNDLRQAVFHSQILVIAVDTPANANGSTNLNNFWNLISDVVEHVDSYKLIVIKSTVPVGTANNVSRYITKNVQQKVIVDVASNPEFLREGSAIYDFMNPDRIVVGTQSSMAVNMMRDLYVPLLDKGSILVVTDSNTAELSKYAANALLATKISFINEMSQIAESNDADIGKIKEILSLDKRINGEFLNAGCGYGGSCFPKDVASLIYTGQAQGYDTHILQAVQAVNKKQQSLLFYKLLRYYPSLSGKTIALWGLAFKPNTDDIRQATSCYLIDLLSQYRVKLKLYDPAALANIQRKYVENKNLIFCDSALNAAQDADALLIVTEWQEFSEIDLIKLKQALKVPAIFDGRNIFSTEEMRNLRVDYFCVGKRPVRASLLEEQDCEANVQFSALVV